MSKLGHKRIKTLPLLNNWVLSFRRRRVYRENTLRTKGKKKKDTTLTTNEEEWGVSKGPGSNSKVKDNLISHSSTTITVNHPRLFPSPSDTRNLPPEEVVYC